MNASTPPSTAIVHDELATLAEVVLARLPLRAAESRRIAAMSELLAAEAALVNCLSEHLHCVRVNFAGTHGSGSLPTVTGDLCRALEGFADQVHRITADYSWCAVDPDDTAEPDPATRGVTRGGAGVAAGERPRAVA